MITKADVYFLPSVVALVIFIVSQDWVSHAPFTDIQMVSCLGMVVCTFAIIFGRIILNYQRKEEGKK